MKMRNLMFVVTVLLSAAAIASILVGPAAGKKKPPPPPPPPPPSSSSTYVRSYASVIDGRKCDLTPEAVQETSDGGAVLLALSSRPSSLASNSCAGVGWLVKLDGLGNPQWQENVGCVGLPDGGYSYGVSLQQTAEGGYVIAGSARDCQSNPICPYLTSVECGMVVKLDAAGKVVWTKVYAPGDDDRDGVLNKIRQTSDGGFVAVGSFHDVAGNIGAWALKLDGGGSVQWQRKLGPGGPSGVGRMHVYFNDVQQTVDGGYTAAGEFTSYARTSAGDSGLLVVRLDANGNVDWQRGFNTFDSSGAPTASEHALSLTQTADGGSLIGGIWASATGPGTCCLGGLLIKLDANGTVQWQRAYSGGVYCYFNGYNTTCTAIGAVAYSVQQTTDGGYILAGAGHLRLRDSVPLVPWIAKVDASGNLLWQHFYYETYSTGRTLSEYFASSTLTSDGGVLAVGFTEDPSDFAGELFAVRTDAAGLVGACGQIHPATPLDPLDPALTSISPGLPVRGTAPPQGNLPMQAAPTSVGNGGGGC